MVLIHIIGVPPLGAPGVCFHEVGEKIYNACLQLAIPDVRVMISPAYTHGACGSVENGEIIFANVTGLEKYNDAVLNGRVIARLPQALKECFPGAKMTGCQILQVQGKWIEFHT